MPALVPSVTSADIAACSWTSSFGTDTAGKISARRSEKSRAAKRTRSAGTEVSATTRMVVTGGLLSGASRHSPATRLLAQPNGFEGLGALLEHPKASDLPVLNCEQE